MIYRVLMAFLIFFLGEFRILKVILYVRYI